jgi:Zn-dependent M28 family amino/carboxypeptidase
MLIFPVIRIFLILTVFIVNDDSVKRKISDRDLYNWVNYLSSDEMKGRRNGSPEMQDASLWISERFIEYGIKMMDGYDGYFQDYTYDSKSGKISERNVVGWIEGSDPVLKNEYIVLSAHFDHIGIEKNSGPDSICNGADDNAAGTATLIAIAKYFRLTGKTPGRSLIFAAFSGEEDGMRGSRHFVKYLPVPANKVFANLNFEMTGHSEELGPNNFYMTGCSFSNLDEIIAGYEGRSGIRLIDDLPVADILFNASDNISFSKMSLSDGGYSGIPSGTFATSTVKSYLHTPYDEISLFDLGNMTSIVNHFCEVVLELSVEKKKINWTDQMFRRP